METQNLEWRVKVACQSRQTSKGLGRTTWPAGRPNRVVWLAEDLLRLPHWRRTVSRQADVARLLGEQEFQGLLPGTPPIGGQVSPRIILYLHVRSSPAEPRDLLLLLVHLYPATSAHEYLTPAGMLLGRSRSSFRAAAARSSWTGHSFSLPVPCGTTGGPRLTCPRLARA